MAHDYMFTYSFDQMCPNGSIATLCTTRLKGGGIKSVRQIFETKMLIYQSEATSDVNVLFGNIIHLLDTEIRKMLEKGLFGNQDSTFYSGP